MSNSGLKIKDVKIGEGEVAAKGANVNASFALRLNHGDVLLEESSMNLTIGKRQVIAGLEKALIGMKVGGERTVRISPHLAYGKKGLPGIVPTDAVLIAQIKLKDVLSTADGC